MKIDRTTHPIIYYAYEFDEIFKRKIFSKFIDTAQTILQITNASEKLKYIFKFKKEVNESDDKIIYEDLIKLLQSNSENRELVLKNVIIIVGNSLVQLLKCLTEDDLYGEHAKGMRENVVEEMESLSTLINIIFLKDCNIELHENYGYHNQPDINKLNSTQFNRDCRLDRENHGKAYHFHYLKLVGKKPERTNLLLYFDNNSNAKKPILLSEKQEKYKQKVYYRGWNERRIGNIYFACKSTLSDINIQEFKKRSKEAEVFFQIIK